MGALIKIDRQVRGIKPNQAGINKLQQDIRINEIHSNIQKRAARFAEIESKIKNSLKEIRIIEDHVELSTGEKGVSLTVEGFGEGIFIEQADIDNKSVTLEQGYQALADLFEHDIVDKLIAEHIERLQQITEDFPLPLGIRDKIQKTISATKALNLDTIKLDSKHEHFAQLDKLWKALTMENIQAMSEGEKIIQHREINKSIN